MKYDTPFWGFVLVAGIGARYRDPSEAEIRFQIFSNLVYGAQGLFYYGYRQPGGFVSCVVARESNPTHHYPQAQRSNAIVLAWSPTLLKLRSTGVYHVGELPQATTALPPEGLVRSVNPSEQLIVGTFDHIESGHYVMLMNKDYQAARRFIIRFAPAVTALAEVSRRTGELVEPTLLTDGAAELYIAAGGARLLKGEK